MSLRKLFGRGITAALLFMFICSAVAAQEDFKDWEEVSLEELLEIEVVTAGKKPQKLKEAPATISVITSEEIHESGAIDIPALLRMVPGIDVLEITPPDQNINARGFNGLMSNQMLVLIDGRSVYWDFYGMVVWDSFPIDMEEIKRIEVIRGPGSVLYGANAFSGVVNIITYKPEEINNTILSMSAGNVGVVRGSLLHSGGAGDFSYKLSLAGEERDRWEKDKGKAMENKKFNGMLSYQPDESSRFDISGGINDGKGLTYTGVGMMERMNRVSYMQLNCDYRDFMIKGFWTRGDVDVKNQDSGEENYFLNDTYDFESQYNLNLTPVNSLVLGGSVRHYSLESDMLDASHTQNLFAAYFSDEHWINDDLAVTLGLRYDRHPLVDPQVSPRGNLMYSPVENHIFRLSYGAAFGNPSFINSYISDELDATERARSELSEEFKGTPMEPFIPALPLLVPDGTVIVDIYGNRELKPGKITTYEVGYQGLVCSKFKGTVNLFYNRLTDLIWLCNVSTRDQDLSVNFGLPPGTIIVPDIPTYSFKNVGKAKSIGGEVGANLLIAPYLSGEINYSYQYITNEEDDPDTPENEKGKRAIEYPANKLNMSLNMKFKNGLSAMAAAHYVGATELREEHAYGKIDDYFLLNGRIAYLFMSGNLEVGLSIYNVLDKHLEYPVTDMTGTQVIADEIGRRVLGNVKINF
jgi:iron complex outermembrane receptor protein